MATGALGLFAAGRMFGLFELFVLGAGSVGLLVVGALTVLPRRFDLDASRSVHPARIHVGADSRVNLTIINRGARASPVVTVRDTLSPVPASSPDGTSAHRLTGRRQARFLLAPLGAGCQDRASYRLPADRRGIFTVGPLQAEVTDAFGLWSRVTAVAPSIELTVYPAIEELVPAIHSRGDDPTSGAPRPATVGPTGEDLYGLRPYEVGDDLRRVHWPSTARTGDLVVRQLELPWQARATVLLDNRTSAHTDASLEAAVSAAASILAAAWAEGALVRLTTSGGSDSGFAAGHDHFDAVMEHLAVIGPGRSDGLEAVVGGLHRAGNGGGLTVVTTAQAPGADLDRMAGLHGRFATPTIVVVDGASGPGTPVRRPVGVTLLRLGAGKALAPTWDAAVRGSYPAAARSPSPPQAR
ncbi:MAG: DUF58 domain-containing protein, partial [Actinomycetota bacterium]|nr:DUF58 domain-containing protein [Actinomycetota bacterium]